MMTNGTLPVIGWEDFEWFIQTYLPKQTIPVLRSFGDTIQTATGTWLGIKSQEKKVYLVEKIEHGFRTMRNQNDLSTYRRVRKDCEGMGQPVKTYNYHYAPPPTFGGVPAHASVSGYQPPPNSTMPHQRYNPLSPAGNGYRSPASYPAHGSRAGGSGWGQAQQVPNVYAQRGTGAQHTLQDWKASPMWKPIKALTSMEMLPDIGANESSHTRRERKVTLFLSPDIIEKMTHSKSHPQSQIHYSIRLFCTSNEHYRPTNAPYSASTAHITNRDIPIEYPSNPDALVDEYSVPFKERGLRGKAGSAPPLDLNKSTKGITLSTGRLTSVVMAHNGPSVGKKKDQSKRFWFQVVFAEMTNKEELLRRLLRLDPTSKEESLAQTRRRDDDDDDIEVGTLKLSLKDPLSYMRITRPVRSSKCTHIQCFDANWWIESNAQHPQWLCPLCSKELKFDDLIVDGFFLDILNTVPDSFDEVVIESNSDWHTEDKKYGAASWLATHQSAPVSNGAVPNGTHHSPTPQAAKPAPKLSPHSPDRKGKRKAIEILSSDEDEDVDVPLSRVNGHTSSSHTASSSHQASLPPPRPPARAPSASSARQQSQQPATTGSGGRIIDLTLDSSDDDEDELEDAYFRQPDVESTSRAADDSTRARHDVGQEVDARQDGFGGGLAGGLGGGGVARGIGTGEVGGDRYGPGGGDRFRSGTGGRDGGEEGGGVPHHWDAWGAEWDEEDDGMRFGQRKRSRASDWMDEEYRD